jgi:hypothetical protein
MDQPWTASVKSTKQLQIFAGAGMSGNWSTLLANALAEFNKLSSANHLGVTYVQSSTPPDPNGPGGAQIRFEVKPRGAVSYTVYGEPITIQVGDGLAGGHTQTIAYSFGGAPAEIHKAFIVLPDLLTANTPSGSRPVGDGVKLTIIVHELVHACGLDRDNASESAPDVFFGSPQLDAGSKPADDKLRAGNLRMPPAVIAAATAQRIQKIWG